MFDLGWGELLLIGAIAVLVVGPKELPVIMVTLGRIFRRLQYVRYAFSRQFEDFLREADLEDIRKQVNFEDKNFDEAEADDLDYENAAAPRALEDQKGTRHEP